MLSRLSGSMLMASANLLLFEKINTYSILGDNFDGKTILAGEGVAISQAIDPACDLCFIKTLRFKASSPYFEGPFLAKQSEYPSLTSSCSVSGYPLTPYKLDFHT